jgi:DNA-binding MarR family transcriptional regulator
MIVSQMKSRVTPSGGPSAKSGAVDPLRLDAQLCFALYAAAAEVTRLYRPHLDALDLTYPQYLAMILLWERAPRTVGEIGAALGLDSATLTPLLKRMEARGHVTRTRDPADERRVLVGLSAAGRRLRAKALAVPEAVVCGIPLPMSQLQSLHADLVRLRGAIVAPSKPRRTRRAGA